MKLDCFIFKNIYIYIHIYVYVIHGAIDYMLRVILLVIEDEQNILDTSLVVHSISTISRHKFIHL